MRNARKRVRDRLTQHLRRRSQQPFHLPEGVSFYERIQRLRLESLQRLAAVQLPCACLRRYVFRSAGCREIRLSGSTRGEWVAPQGVALSPTLR
jgi:hypothetical protein